VRGFLLFGAVLNQSLDVFRGFFVDPLLTPDAIADESQAVNRYDNCFFSAPFLIPANS
jgi:hypothetical protein